MHLDFGLERGQISLECKRAVPHILHSYIANRPLLEAEQAHLRRARATIDAADEIALGWRHRAQFYYEYWEASCYSRRYVPRILRGSTLKLRISCGPLH